MLYVFSMKILLAFVERISKVVPIVDMYYIDNDIVFSFSLLRVWKEQIMKMYLYLNE